MGWMDGQTKVLTKSFGVCPQKEQNHFLNIEHASYSSTMPVIAVRRYPMVRKLCCWLVERRRFYPVIHGYTWVYMGILYAYLHLQVYVGSPSTSNDWKNHGKITLAVYATSTLNLIKQTQSMDSLIRNITSVLYIPHTNH